MKNKQVRRFTHNMIGETVTTTYQFRGVGFLRVFMKVGEDEWVTRYMCPQCSAMYETVQAAWACWTN